jgi:hypothetical protein
MPAAAGALSSSETGSTRSCAALGEDPAPRMAAAVSAEHVMKRLMIGMPKEFHEKPLKYVCP